MTQKRDNVVFDIILALLKKEFHVRGLAQELDQSHSTVARRLYTLKKEHIVDAKEEGKNKVFFLKKNFLSQTYIHQAELYKRAQLFKSLPEFDVLFEDIIRKTDGCMVILFGSYAKGLMKKNSDIDIYIETTNKKIKKEVENIYSRISVKIGPFDTASPLVKEIIKDHVIIKGVESFYERKNIFT